jgi:integrase
MVAHLTENALKHLPAGQNLDIHDTKEPRFILRVRATGRHSYCVRLGKGARRYWYTLGLAEHYKPAEARDLARDAIIRDGKGDDLREEKRKKTAATFTAYLDTHYAPWATAHLKSADGLLSRLRKQFEPLFGTKPLDEIDAFAVERWRTARLKVGKTKATSNRDLAALKAALSKAVEWNMIRDHPLRRVKLSKEDRSAVVRFLSPEEEKTLRASVLKRDEDRKAARTSANEWRRKRGYTLLPEYGIYSDHLAPIVLLALNTGCRRGELLGLAWQDVDLARAILTVRGEGAKSGRTRHIPLNAEAVQVLKDWPPQGGDLVFPGDDGDQMITLKTAWLKLVGETGANLTDFRFHDLRHTFASKLVQRGVDLATVRELLGHSDFALTLRYAHLAAENKAAAVARLA